jgi:hypothetical protein
VIGTEQTFASEAATHWVDDDFEDGGSSWETVAYTYDDTLDLARLGQGRASNLTNDGIYSYMYDP